MKKEKPVSGFLNETNHGRVAKMRDMVGLLDKSAKSNRADRDEIEEVLQPLVEAIDGLLGGREPGGAAEAPAPVPARSTGKLIDHPRACASDMHPPEWAAFRDMALVIPFDKVGPAMAVLTDRIDTALHEIKMAGEV